MPDHDAVRSPSGPTATSGGERPASPRTGIRLSPHRCHAWGCQRVVPERLLMCGPHWRMVPPALQRRVWATYRPGQERTKNPSEEYLDAARAAIRSVAELEGASR
jgi:hypothetical protein